LPTPGQQGGERERERGERDSAGPAIDGGSTEYSSHGEREGERERGREREGERGREGLGLVEGVVFDRLTSSLRVRQRERERERLFPQPSTCPVKKEWHLLNDQHERGGHGSSEGDRRWGPLPCQS
jgi:hypothetical protein